MLKKASMAMMSEERALCGGRERGRGVDGGRDGTRVRESGVND